MLKRIKFLQSIGQFDKVCPPEEVSFKPFSLIYGENGRGKTTITAILRSLATNKPELIKERRRLGAQCPPKVVIEHEDGESIFQDDAWSQPISNIEIFDDAFVAENVCSGMEVQSAQRQNLHELILGSRGVALNNALQEQIRRIDEHNAKLKELKEKIPANALGPHDVDSFCNLEQDHDIDAKILEAERHYKAAQSAKEIQQRPVFQDISLPEFDAEAIDAVLKRDLPQLEIEAEQRVQAHLAKLGDTGESWVAQGIPYIEKISANTESEICPFCAQSLAGSQLIKHYRAYFSEGYSALKAEIQKTDKSVRDAHSRDIQLVFERKIQTTIQTHEFWKDFAELSQINIDTEALSKQWNAARNSVLEELRTKAAAPLESMALKPATRDAIANYHARVNEVAELSTRLAEANAKLQNVKEQAKADELDALNDNLKRLKAKKERFNPSVKSHCDNYLAKKNAKAETEKLRDQARDALSRYREDIFPELEGVINDYLQQFGASFQLKKVNPVNTRSGSSASYCIAINEHNVDSTAKTGPSFKNTLSAGDRNTLALAFFFASLENDPDLKEKIVVIDDPMTSLDDHRTQSTRREIRELSEKVQQIIILSHSKLFLGELWEDICKDSPATLLINRLAGCSELTIWNVQDAITPEHDKRHELVRNYLKAAGPDKEREVASALRPILEAFIRVAYPEHFPPRTFLGKFIDKCENSKDKILSDRDLEELKNLLKYANQFHHSTKAEQQINDTELKTYAEQILRFTSRR